MTEHDRRTDAQPRPPRNREQRRAERFGRPDGVQDDLRRQSEHDPAWGRGGGSEGDDSESFAGRADQDVVRTTGAGAAGATESDGRVTHHEGAHLGNQPNS